MGSEVSEIARFADSPDAELLMAGVMEHDLPPVVDWLVDEYHRFEGARDRFMWKWVHELAPRNALPCVDEGYEDRVATDKTLTILFVTLLDDVLEKRRDYATFEEASKAPFPDRNADLSRPGVDAEYVRFTEQVWETLEDRLRRAPRFEEYLELLRFDLKQVVNAIEYSYLAILQPELTTLADLMRYESHNMAMFVYADIDLMHTTGAPELDLPTLREGVWFAQQMARIGNWVSTWERELAEGDFSSGVVAYALQEDIVDLEELRALEDDGSDAAIDGVADRIQDAGVEALFLDRWDEHYEDLLEVDEDLEDIDLRPYADGLKEVLRYHLASKGLK